MNLLSGLRPQARPGARAPWRSCKSRWVTTGGRLVLLVFVLAPGLAKPVLAQQPVFTYPKSVTTANSNGSSTIGSTGVFQLVFAANTRRSGCTIQNNGTHTMYVTEGLGTTASTTANSAQLAAGATYTCHWAGNVLNGEIDITGTSGEAFYAAQE